MSAARALRDFQSSEIALALVLGASMLGGAALGFGTARWDRRAPFPASDRSTPVRVKVVEAPDPDAPLLKLGGERVPAKLPDRIAQPAPRPRVESRSVASPRAGKKVEDASPRPPNEPDAGPPPPDAEVVKQNDAPAVVADAGPAPNVDQKGHADGVKEGTETDPLKARAVDLYRAKIAAWLSSRFRVSGSGLPKEELLKYRVSATVSVGGDRTVTSYAMVPSGNAAFDAAARAALESAKGSALPPPPENYPDVVQSSVHVTFVCKEDRCD